ncbi:MAG: hypothetical protein C4530_03590 [Desulfobacteraceae bacterium]|nr:MAG: hypothetical protein C4530_03590 [Desulfobacteraceae bacterium]
MRNRKKIFVLIAGAFLSMKSKKGLFVVSVLLPFFLLNCVQTPVRTEPLPGDPIAHFPKMVVGDRWVEKGYSSKYNSDLFYSKVIEVYPDGGFMLESTEKRDKTVYHERYNNKYQLTERTDITAGEKQPVNDPPSKRLDFPLFVGKTWADTYHGESVDGGSYTYKNYYQVVGFEKVRIEAGVFDAFKIYRDHRIMTSSDSFTETYWYSPLVKSNVKSDPSWRIGYEVIEYNITDTASSK